ncbi:MAG TPA: dihydrodipicolinate synthase family protein [Bryobacteraceae bacterium]|nr:dihydrodipicolinate synthase family protein [Bryobacteraceae bacterium]HPT28168.1 dihydrodipicolinate synthase family protein [Bryobacteraceae bacterium]
MIGKAYDSQYPVMAGKIEGILTPTLVPLDANGQVNETEFRRFLNWLIDAGVHGLYPNGSTGEFTRLTAEERRRIAKIACEEARGRVPVLAGAAEANTRETIKACETYYEYGARAVAIVSPIYYRLAPDSVYAYFAEIARNVPIDVTLYNIPLFASPIDLATITRLAADFPRIVGIKDSSGDVAFMMRMIASIRPIRPDFSFLTGWDVVLAPMMLTGCDGGTNATSNVVPELTRKLYDLFRAGHLDQAMALQFRILELFDHMLSQYEFPDGFRVGAELRGFNMGHGRQPLTAKQEAAKESLTGILQCMLSSNDLVAPPSGGCAPKSIARDELETIVFQVMTELERKGGLWKTR